MLLKILFKTLAPVKNAFGSESSQVKISDLKR